MARDVPLYNREDLVTNRQLPPLLPVGFPLQGAGALSPITQAQPPGAMFAGIRAALAPPPQQAPLAPPIAPTDPLQTPAPTQEDPTKKRTK